MNTARRTHGFRESVIRGMTRLAREYGSINLAQGFPNFPAPELLKDAAARAIHDDINQYAITWGAQGLRDAIAQKYHQWYQLEIDPEREITVTCGATEAMISTLLAIVDPGDEVIVFEPFYENYGPGYHPGRCQAGIRPTGAGDAARSGPAGLGVFLPHPRHHRQYSQQPCGTGADPRRAGGHPRSVRPARCPGRDGRDLRAHPVRGGPRPHCHVARHADRTITISGASKTFSVTGWRIGWILAPAELTDAIRKVHDFLTVGAPAPLQEGVAVALDELGPSFYRGLAATIMPRRDLLFAALIDAGFSCTPPEGAYYILSDFSGWSCRSGSAGVGHRIRRVALPRGRGHAGSGIELLSRRQAAAASLVRFVFCKTDDILLEAARRLRIAVIGVRLVSSRHAEQEAAARSGLQQ